MKFGNAPFVGKPCRIFAEHKGLIFPGFRENILKKGAGELITLNNYKLKFKLTLKLRIKARIVDIHRYLQNIPPLLRDTNLVLFRTRYHKLRYEFSFNVYFES